MMLNAIAALNHNSVLICFQEFIIKDDCPLCVIDFSMAMGHECCCLGPFHQDASVAKALNASGSCHSKRNGGSHTY
jgi:hypothetical protein